MSHDHQIWQLLDRLQMDNRAQAAKLVELRALVANIDLPNPNESVCDVCGAKHRHKHAMEEHRYIVHDGPVPAHYLAAEARAIPDTLTSEEQECYDVAAASIAWAREGARDA